MLLIVTAGQIVNADSPVSFEQGYLKSYVLFVILVAGAGFEPAAFRL